MDNKFRPAFEEQVNYFATKAGMPEYAEIYQMIKSVRSLVPLRPDAELFLMINAGQLIVVPWNITTQGDFLRVHGKLLRDDLSEIIAEASAVASRSKRDEISANALVSVVANRTVGTRTRGLNIWGP